ncbi:MAG: sugar phosphate isomerase/epimerase [Planctomycetales bacterium]|nr:sugar phosphate isomerase/epimerase [Planctomycetales bacterium]
MYKNLNCELLGISGRQSEIIELALTYGFRGIDIDIADLVKRCQRSSFESAARFLTSSKLSMAGFDAPIDLDSDEDTYAAQAARLNGVAEIAQRANAMLAIVSVPAATNRLPYPEYFEVIRKRIDEIAGIFLKENVRVALSFATRSFAPEGKQFKFVQDADGFAALMRACTAGNLGMVFDSWIWHLAGGTMDTLQSIGPKRVFSVRLGDCKEGLDLASATAEDCLLPNSTGVIDNVGYLAKLAEHGGKLPVAARGLPLGESGTRDALISKAQDALDQTLEQAGLPSVTRKPETYVAAASYRSYSERT